MRVPSDGGEPEVVVQAKPPEVMDSPQILDGGRAVLFSLITEGGADRWDKAQVIVQSLQSGERKVVFRGGSAARYVPTGHLVYALGGTLLAVPFDLKNLQVKGSPVPVLDGVMRPPAPANNSGEANFVFSAGGSLAYVPGTTQGSSGPTVVALVDRSGKVQPLGLPPQPYVHPRISPDGKQLVVGADDGILWVYDLGGNGPPRRLTFGGRNSFPIWSRDSRFITFQSDREGDLGVFRQAADGSGTPERLTKADQGTSHEPETWSPDGRILAINMTRGADQGIWTVSFDGERKPQPFYDVLQIQKHSVFSPDGKWIAYMSTELGGNVQVFVQPFPATGAKYQISTDSGRTPLWSPDGKQLFYHHVPSNRLVAVDVQTTPTFTFGKPSPLPIEGTVHPQAQRNYDITPDGKEFVVILPASTSTTDSTQRSTQQINIVLNWFEELKARVPLR